MPLIDYIWSALGLTSGANEVTAFPSRKDEGNPQTLSASCEGWSRPDPAVRLREQDNMVIRIFGFPEREDLPPGLRIAPMNVGNSGMPILYLRGEFPPYVDYIMGHDWRSRLGSGYETADGHAFKGGKVILREDERELDERDHCLRMRRCGAVAIRSEMDIILEETDCSCSPAYMFGWPAGGGVWILCRDPFNNHELDSAPIGSNPLDFAALNEMQERFYSATENSKQQDSMEGICRVIKQAGGRFYSNIGDCPEAVHLKLLV
ncbi:hypothetical protein K431DRAFT_287476 [Polychaeton citri CBS 116435]|uniref:Uncharacterized protein n=1 Tax=Polychaeton citri CBS 116435 TaxID=1314669 RepID=A0A9P4UM82_9PEZI|nr:hypothetical protein K431DRAFT_287476 [Polychaeton citri CBS 116435]